MFFYASILPSVQRKIPVLAMLIVYRLYELKGKEHLLYLNVGNISLWHDCKLYTAECTSLIYSIEQLILTVHLVIRLLPWVMLHLTNIFT